MKLLSRSALVASVAAASLLAAAVPSSAYSGCALSKFNAPQATASGDGAGGFWSASPDSSALGAALGGLGMLAALLSGGTVLVRQRRLAQAAAVNAAAPEAEVNLGTAAETEIVLVGEPTEIETEVALAYRR